MTKLIILLLTLLPVLSYSQVTSINVDTSIHRVIIINNGTLIENNQGTVNVNVESKCSDSVEVTKLRTPNEVELAVMYDDCKVNYSADYNSDNHNSGYGSVCIIFAMIAAFIIVFKEITG